MPQALDDIAPLALRQGVQGDVSPGAILSLCRYHIGPKIRELARAPKALPHFQPGATPQANAFPAKRALKARFIAGRLFDEAERL
jgi:hypothetical protein